MKVSTQSNKKLWKAWKSNFSIDFPVPCVLHSSELSFAGAGIPYDLALSRHVWTVCPGSLSSRATMVIGSLFGGKIRLSIASLSSGLYRMCSFFLWYIYVTTKNFQASLTTILTHREGWNFITEKGRYWRKADAVFLYGYYLEFSVGNWYNYKNEKRPAMKSQA